MRCWRRGFFFSLVACLCGSGGAVRPQNKSPLKPTDGADCRVLFFSAVGSHFRTTVKQNALHLHGSGLVDIFLAHPGTSDLVDWQKDSWYNQTVKYSVSYNEKKAGLVWKELVKQQTFRLGGYCWYWIADEDVDLTRLNLRRYLGLATESGASIVQPAVALDASAGIPLNDVVMAYSDYVELPHHSASHSHSLYRYSELVQAMSPMFTAQSLPVAWELYIPGLQSAGMELVWCRFVAAQLNRSDERGCAIIDAEHMYKLPNIGSDGLKVPEVDEVVRQHPEYLQRIVHKFGKIRAGLKQLCRTDHDDKLVRVSIRPRHFEAMVLLKAFFRCKQHSLQAVCNIDLGSILKTVLWLLLEVVLWTTIPVVLWRTVKYLWQQRSVKDVSFSRRIRTPYRHQFNSDTN